MDPEDPDSDLDQWINPKIVSFLPFQTYPENLIEIRKFLSYLSLQITFHGSRRSRE